MTEEAAAIEGAETPLEQDDSITVDDLVNVRLGETAGAETEEQPEVEEQPEAEPEEDLANINLDDMSEVELKELGGKLGSKAVSRFGAMTAKNKALEEELQRLKTERESNPLEAPEPPESNPYSDLKTLPALQAKAKEVSEVIEWAEDLLEENDDASSDDEVTEVDGKSYTKSEVRQALKKARKAKDKYLPAQLNELRTADQRSQFRTQIEAKAKEELPWIGQEDDEINAVYQKMLADPRVKALETQAPDIAPQLPYLLAHAANSMVGKGKAKVTTTGKAPKLKAPSTPVSTGAPTSKPEAGNAKQLADLKARFAETGDPADMVALRAFQISNKR